jgi:hypothetical protein
MASRDLPFKPLLFVYGTLRDPDLLAGVLGRPLSAPAVLPAHAPGFAALVYPGRLYPGLVRSPGAAADGLVLTDLTAFERDLLDAYEGPEYARTALPVMVAEELHEAFAYLPVAAVPATAPAWRLSDWQARHKPSVLVAECVAAAQLREKLIALRPN